MRQAFWILAALACFVALSSCTSTGGESDSAVNAQIVSAEAVPASLLEEAVRESYFQDVTRDLTVRRDSAMRALTGLSESESDAFWSIKEEYDREVGELFDEELALVAEFTEVREDLTGEIAADLARRSLELDRRALDLHQEYFTRMKEEFSPAVAVQWLQLQSYFEHRAHAKLAEGTPLAMP